MGYLKIGDIFEYLERVFNNLVVVFIPEVFFRLELLLVNLGNMQLFLDVFYALQDKFRDLLAEQQQAQGLLKILIIYRF